jgi:hypothetical protein
LRERGGEMDFWGRKNRKGRKEVRWIENIFGS